MFANQCRRSGRISRPSGSLVLASSAIAMALVASACANLDTLGSGAASRADNGVAAAAGFEMSPKQATATPVTQVPASSLDPRTSLTHARGLKKAGRTKEAYAALEAASQAAPDNRTLMVERGLMALELGKVAEAQQLLARSNDLKPKDWRVLSALGIAASSRGQQKDAQKYFKSALDASPENAAVLNNLALTYLLERKVDQAEALLRRASKTKSGDQIARVAQNLALAAAIRTEQRSPDEATPVASAGERARPIDSPPMGLTGGGLDPAHGGERRTTRPR